MLTAPSIVVEGYRHLVDDAESMTADRVRERRLVRATSVEEILDLRGRQNRLAIGIADAGLFSDLVNYDACHRNGHVAHQLGLHGFSPLQPPVAHLIGSLETSSMFIETSS
ncbi:MAG: hypothetical protein ACR2GF_01790 [Acidimicrobiales bacterium]